MTTRRWMIAVAVAGIGLAARIQMARWGQLREQYQDQAETYAEIALHFRQFADRTRDEWLSDCRRVDELNALRVRGLRKSIGELLYPPGPDEGRKTVAHFERLRQVYERAARYPWLPVEPDPPQTESAPRRID
jgi:hypothetical protein